MDDGSDYGCGTDYSDAVYDYEQQDFFYCVNGIFQRLARWSVYTYLPYVAGRFGKNRSIFFD